MVLFRVLIAAAQGRTFYGYELVREGFGSRYGVYYAIRRLAKAGLLERAGTAPAAKKGTERTYWRLAQGQ